MQKIYTKNFYDNFYVVVRYTFHSKAQRLAVSKQLQTVRFRMEASPSGQEKYGAAVTNTVRYADIWREECWQMIRERSDLHFIFLTKRIKRFMDCVPTDWNDGYDEEIYIKPYLEDVELVVVGGESGREARPLVHE